MIALSYLSAEPTMNNILFSLVLIVFSLPAHAEPKVTLPEKFGGAIGNWIHERIWGTHERQFLRAGLSNCIQSFETSRVPDVSGFKHIETSEVGSQKYIRNRISIKNSSVREDKYRACTVDISTGLHELNDLEIDWRSVRNAFDNWADLQIKNGRYCDVAPKDPTGIMRILDFKGPRDGKALRVFLNIVDDLNYGFIVAAELEWDEANTTC